VFSSRDPVSTAFTTPQRVSMARTRSVSSAAGREAADWNAASMKCTWAFQNPAVTVSPVPSSTVAWSGTRTWSRRPTALMVVPVMTTTPPVMAASVGEV